MNDPQLDRQQIEALSRIGEIGWPSPLEAAAHHGLAGEVVSTIEPHSEADPAALLLQFLAAFGSAAGRDAGFQAEADFHGTNLDVLLVGPTSKARKGSSWGQASRPAKLADESWEARILGGLSSGEGLIHAVRDQRTIRRRAKTAEEKKRADADGCIEEIADDGEPDKRLLAYESEFASVLRVMGRDGSTLSAIIRQAWESGELRTLTKNNPDRASGAHVSIVGHISQEELRRELSSTDAASGFANRFLFACVRRSKQLPEGGTLTDADWHPIVPRVRAALDFASSAGVFHRGAEARQLWAEVYGELSEGKPGLFGAVTARAEAQVMRLAVVYALLDRSPEVRVPHLRASLAVWRYCEASCRYLFGDALGDPCADVILRALSEAGTVGLSRTEVRDQFGRHRRAGEIEGALALLESRGLAERRMNPTGGRPEERWFVTDGTGQDCDQSDESDESTPDADLSSHRSLSAHPKQVSPRPEKALPFAEQVLAVAAECGLDEWPDDVPPPTGPVWDYTQTGGDAP